MSHRVLNFVGGLTIAACVVAAPFSLATLPALAQATDTKPADQQAPAGQDTSNAAQKVDEYAEAQRVLNGPAGNAECVWLGRRVVLSLIHISKVSALLNGRLANFSSERLMRLLTSLGQDVDITIKDKPRSRVLGRVRVVADLPAAASR